MKNKIKYLVIGVFLLVLLLGGINLLTSNKNNFFTKKQLKQSKVHFYEEPNIDISKIKLYIFYVIPANKTDKIKDNWQSLIKNHLDQITAFHQRQFKNLSTLEYEFYQQPVTLTNEIATNNQPFDVFNLDASLKIAEEIYKTLTQELKLLSNHYNILTIIYEGEGAFGGAITEKNNLVEKYKLSSKILPTTIENFDGIVFLSAGYLEKDYGESIFYHEIAHTLGIPDAYQNNKSLSDDIMGNGRFEPLENNYLDNSVLNKMIEF
jgi:hypothetical protein